MTLLDQLKDTDSFGLTLFDDESQTLQPLTPVRLIDKPSLKNEIQKLQPRGGTEMLQGIYLLLFLLFFLFLFFCFCLNFLLNKGFRAALSLFDAVKGEAGLAENRIMFLTDAQPNDKEEAIFDACKVAAEGQDKIYSTFIGVGIDFGVKV